MMSIIGPGIQQNKPCKRCQAHNDDGHAGKAEAEYNGSDDYCEQNIHNVMLPEGD